MRKVFAITGALLTAVMLCACGNDTVTISGNVTNIDNGSGNSSVSGENNTAEQTENTNSGDLADANTENDYSDRYYFEYNNAVVTVDMTETEVTESLGEALSCFEASSCAFEGMERTYTYQDFQVVTYEDGDTDRISSIILTDDLVETREGVAIGDSADKLDTVYPEPTFSEDNTVKYEKGGMCLIFITEDDKIISIQYVTAALE